jgi:uncharacterized membrane protein YkgB
MEDAVNKAFQYALRFAAASTSYRAGMVAMKVAISIVFLWIGALKFVAYEADSITPFVANSPFMSFFYKQPKQYKQHLTAEGVLNPADRNWQTSNNTYSFSKGLGILEMLIGALTFVGIFSQRVGLVGALLSFCTAFVTLSFLTTTPEAWVSNLGDNAYGFPFLSGAGRLVLKDVMLLAGAWLIVCDCARMLLLRGPARSTSTAIDFASARQGD